MNENGKINIIIVVLIIVVQILIGVALYFFVFRDKSEPVRLTTLEKTHVPEARPQISAERNSRDTSIIADFEAKDYLKDYTLFSMGDLIVNPSGAESRFFIVSIVLEHRQSDRRLPDELKSKTPLIKDRMIFYFSRLTVEDLQDVDNREVFKEDLIKLINGLLVEGRITSVLFDQYVIQ